MNLDKLRQFAYLEAGPIWRCKFCGRRIREINILAHLKRCFPIKTGEFVYNRKREEIDLVRISKRTKKRFYKRTRVYHPEAIGFQRGTKC